MLFCLNIRIFEVNLENTGTRYKKYGNNIDVVHIH